MTVTIILVERISYGHARQLYTPVWLITQIVQDYADILVCYGNRRRKGLESRLMRCCCDCFPFSLLICLNSLVLLLFFNLTCTPRPSLFRGIQYACYRISIRQYSLICNPLRHSSRSSELPPYCMRASLSRL